MLEVIRRPTKTFKVLGWRWIVERTFGWLNWQRKLSKDYEYLPPNEKAWFYLVSPWIDKHESAEIYNIERKKYVFKD